MKPIYVLMTLPFILGLAPVNTTHKNFNDVDTEFSNLYGNVQPKGIKVQRVQASSNTLVNGEPVIVSTNGVVKVYWRVYDATYSVTISS